MPRPRPAASSVPQPRAHRAAATILLVLALLPSGLARAEERLALPEPDGWEQLNWLDAAGVWRADFRIPPGQPGAGEDGDFFTAERFSSEPLPDPIDFLESFARNMRELCGNDARSYRTFSGEENGYPSAVRLITCPSAQNTTEGQVSFMKAIRGDDGFFVVSRTRRMPAFTREDLPVPEEDIALWSRQFRTITLCAAGNEDHPCAVETAGQP